MFEVARQQAREALGRQMDLLEQERLAAGQAQALEIDDRLTRLERQGAGDRHRRRLRSGRDQPGLGVETALPHLFGEARPRGDVAIEARMEDERAAPARPFDPALTHQLVERATDGDQTAAVMGRELALRRQLPAGWPPTGLEGGEQVEIHLMVQRDGAELESEPSQPGRSSSWIDG